MHSFEKKKTFALECVLKFFYYKARLCYPISMFTNAIFHSCFILFIASSQGRMYLIFYMSIHI